MARKSRAKKHSKSAFNIIPKLGLNLSFKKIKKLKKPQKQKIILQALVLLLLFSATLVLLFNTGQQTSQTVAKPIRYLIASISAQGQPIKIDPEFSYSEPLASKEPPIRIAVPSVRIDIKVVEAPIVRGYWQTATDSASFGLGSAYPDTVGNTVIFAHAQEGLFADLSQIKKGANIYLFTNSSWYSYQVVETKLVLPNQIEVVSPTKEQTLTLYTCDGYGDVYRFVVIAKLRPE